MALRRAGDSLMWPQHFCWKSGLFTHKCCLQRCPEPVGAGRPSLPGHVEAARALGGCCGGLQRTGHCPELPRSHTGEAGLNSRLLSIPASYQSARWGTGGDDSGTGVPDSRLWGTQPEFLAAASLGLVQLLLLWTLGK